LTDEVYFSLQVDYLIKLLNTNIIFNSLEKNFTAFSQFSKDSVDNVKDSPLENLSSIITQNVKRFNGMIRRNSGRPLIGWLIKSFGDVGSPISIMKVKLICIFAFRCHNIWKHQGMKGLVLDLKVSSVLINQASAGYKVMNINTLKRRVRRSRSGFPLWIPVIYRQKLKKGDIRLYEFLLSLTSIYRKLEYKGVISLNSITSPGPSMSRLSKSELLEFNLILSRFWTHIEIKKYISEWENTLIKYFPILSGSPTSSDKILDEANIDGKKRYAFSKAISSTYYSIYSASKIWLSSKYNDLFFYINLFLSNTNAYEYLEKNIKKISSRGYTLNDIIIEINKVKNNKISFGEIRKFLRKDIPSYLGRLGFKDEPAGKIRVFAIVDCWTQWILYPLHKLLQKILINIEEDATFDQLGRLENKIEYVKSKKIKLAFSYDLSAATDRLPVLIQEKLLVPLIGEDSAYSWRKLLTDRVYNISPGTGAHYKIPKDKRDVKYAVGQPMGAYSSWVMLALTHHLIVQWAAFSIYGSYTKWKWFKLYIILGDDIVIFDSKVAKRYLYIMNRLGVSIGLAKSIISNKSLTLEFARKFFVKGKRVRFIPPGDLIVTQVSTCVLNEFLSKYGLKFNSYLKLRGLGYKTRSKVNANFWNMSSRLRTYMIVFLSTCKVDWVTWVSLKSRNSSHLITEKALYECSIFLSEKIHNIHLNLIKKLELRKQEIQYFSTEDISEVIRCSRADAEMFYSYFKKKEYEYFEDTQSFFDLYYEKVEEKRISAYFLINDLDFLTMLRNNTAYQGIITWIKRFSSLKDVPEGKQNIIQRIFLNPEKLMNLIFYDKNTSIEKKIEFLNFFHELRVSLQREVNLISDISFSDENRKSDIKRFRDWVSAYKEWVTCNSFFLKEENAFLKIEKLKKETLRKEKNKRDKNLYDPLIIQSSRRPLGLPWDYWSNLLRQIFTKIWINHNKILSSPKLK
jgi:hypothetical protein